MNLLSHIWTSLSVNFLSADGYFFWGWVLSYIAVGIFISFRAQKSKFSWKKAIQYCFPKKTFLTPSAILDYKIFLVSTCFILYPVGLLWMESKNRVATTVATKVADGMSMLGPFAIPFSNGFWVDFVFTAVLLLATDFGWTVQHMLFHRVPFLWRFHKVHHTATELNLFTVTRLHPIEAFAQSWATGFCIAAFVGGCKALLGYTPSVVFVMNVSWALVLYRITGIYRHSHMWVPFPRLLSYIFCSPAMHHIHHSVEFRHHDKNFSNVFSFWDWVFGTIYIPKSKEKIVFGVPPEKGYRDYTTLRGCLIHPFLPDSLLERFYREKKPRKYKKAS